MSDHEQEFSLKNLFVPLTTFKAIHIIVILGFIVFGNMLFNGFVWDDKTYIIFNTDIHSLDFLKLLGKNLFNAGGQYRPIPAIYFATLYSIFKETPFFYHLFQLILHITNASMVFILFKRFINARLSLFLALVFLVHPIQVESVSYIAASVNPLFFLFGISALLLSLKETIYPKRLIMIFTLLFLSLLTKEAGILFFWLIFLSVTILKKRLKSREVITFIIIGFITIVVYFLIRFSIGGIYFMSLPYHPIARLSLGERLLNIPAIIFYYVRTFFFPVQLAIDQEWTIKNLNFQTFYSPLLIDCSVFLLLGLLGFFLFQKHSMKLKPYLFFVLWFLAGLGMYAQIFPLDATVADRWFYFPLVGLLGLLGLFIQSFKFSNEKIRALGLVVGLIIIIVLSFRTIVRNANWSNAISLYSHDRQIHDNFDIENNLGTEYAAINEYRHAIEHQTRSITMFANEANLYNLANIYERMGNKSTAEKYYTEALNAKNYLPINHSHFAVTYVRLAYLLYLKSDFNKAKIVAKRGLLDYPDNGYLSIELAASEYKLGNYQSALAAVEKARTLSLNEQINSIYLQIKNKQTVDVKL